MEEKNNKIYETIARIAAHLISDGKTATTNELADELGIPHSRIRIYLINAYHAMENSGRYTESCNIANAYIRPDGKTFNWKN